MEKIIFVNATSASRGGMLTILNQFISEVKKRSDYNHKYYIFVSIEMESNSDNIVMVNNVRGKKTLDRIKWDMFGMKKWSKDNNINPDLIISLQNTGVMFNKVKQIVYLHQPLPYAKESKWSFIRKDERKLWIYKNIFKYWIDLTVKNKSIVIVQTEWMKQALLRRKYNPNNIILSRPNVEDIDVNEIRPAKREYNYLFYPAADYKYKNHKILINAVKYISSHRKINEKFKIILTLDKSSYIYSQIKKKGIEEYFEFVGNIKYEEVLSYYKGCQAVLFPSYIETFGLPLIEASMFGKKILVSDCEYSKEVLGDYKNIKLIKYDDYIEWGKLIEFSLKEYYEIPYVGKNKNGWSIMFETIEKLVLS